MWNSKNFIISILLIFSFEKIPNIVGAQDIIDCSGIDLVTSVFNDPIDLNFSGTIKVYENVNITEILSTSNNDFTEKYLEARLETIASGQQGNITKNLLIFTTDTFQDYAKKQNATRISLKINLGCGMGRERILVFFQPLREGNYFAPIFMQSLYELTLPTPIFAGFELTSLYDISAHDDDLENNQIHFTSITSAPYRISIGTKNVTSVDKKTYFANLTLERIFLELPQQIEFVIIATDNGIPPRSSNATVIIRSDPLRRLPVQPRFEHELYRGYINVIFTMEPIAIKLSQDSYDPQVNFSLSGSVIDGFEMLDTGNGSIEILWNATKVNQTYIMANKQWQLEVKAQHPGLTVLSVATILVDLADFQSFFHFMSLYYEGHMDADNKLHMTPIIFYPFAYKPDINFTFLENPHNMFAVTNEGFRLEVRLMANFSLDTFANNSFIKLALQASWQHLTSVCYIVIELPQRTATIEQQEQQQQHQMLHFAKPLYVGNITELNKLEMESIVLQTDANATQSNEFQLMGEWSHLFRLNINGSHVKLEIDLTRNITDKHLKSPILLVLEVKSSSGKASTSMVLNIQREKMSLERRDIFEASTLMGKLLLNQNNTQVISMAPILLRPMENVTNYEFSLEGSDVTEFFELQMDAAMPQVKLTLKKPLTNKTLEENHFLLLAIISKLKGSKNNADNLTVFIELPIRECPVMPFPLPGTPIFVEGNYVFTMYTNETGGLGFVNAFVKDSNASLHYILEVENEILAQSLSVSPFSGELILYRSLTEGTHKFNVTAENLLTHEKAKIQALLKVQAKEECTIYQGPTVAQTLVVKHIDEERRYHGLWNMTHSDNCSYHILEMWPKEKAYVYVNETSNTLDIVAADREDHVFKEMLQAEIIVRMRLICKGQKGLADTMPNQEALKLDNVTRLPRSTLWPFDDNLYSQNISFATDIMWLHLIIDDINDNAPQFAQGNGPQYLGYPSGKMALDVYPEYLAQIIATDRDLGLNAKIRYTLRDNEYFAIEPETGKIYPKGRILQPEQQIELIVLAVDQDGQGLMTGTVVIVKGLAANFYSLISIGGNASKSATEVSQELSAEMECDVKILKMSYVPQMAGAARASSSRDIGLICKVWIYAFRDQELVQSKDLQKSLENSPSPSIVNIESYEQAGLQSNVQQQSSSTVGYVVAISLLSVISGSSLVFIIWRFYCYNETESGCGTKGNSSAQQVLHSSASSGHHRRGNGQPTECSYGDNNTNQVKFSSIVDKVKSDRMCP